MPIVRLAEITWEDAASLGGDETVAILPVGAIEAHGPHLPLGTDSIISAAMADHCAELLHESGWTVVLLPPIPYTAAPFAAEFPGTLSIRPEILSELLLEVGNSLREQAVHRLAIANAHLDPTHLGSLHNAVSRLQSAGSRVAFPDLTHRPWARRLSEEFRSGACHAGRFEGSIVLASRPDLVRSELQKDLEPNPSSLSAAIRAGSSTFREAGGPRAYFGDPARATAEEGRETIAELGRILRDSIVAPEAEDGGRLDGLAPPL